MSESPSGPDTDHDRALERREEESIARMRALLDRPLSDADLRANAEIVAVQAEARRRRMASVLVFEIGEERLGIAAEESHRVVPCSVVRRVPHRTNDVFAGIANIGGELTLVAHAGRAFGIDAGAMQTHFVVIGDAGARWAFAVDRVEGVRRMDADAALPPPATVRHAGDGCTRAIAEIAPLDGRASALVGLLDTARVAALFSRSLA
jgi:chemotaxis signal transduction protein